MMSFFYDFNLIYFSFFFCYEKAERVHELNEEIGKMLARAEQLGGEGNVDEAQQLLEMVEKTRALKKEAEVRSERAAFLLLGCQKIFLCMSPITPDDLVSTLKIGGLHLHLLQSLSHLAYCQSPGSIMHV